MHCCAAFFAISYLSSGLIMTLILKRLEAMAVASPWVLEWFRDGMVCCQDWALRDEPKRHGVFEVKDRSRLPAELGCLGGGGWTSGGVLDWVGFDLDVGHGNEKQVYPTTDDAIDAAKVIRELVRDAGEIRLSKSGVGVHVRVRVAPIDVGEESAARKIAKNIAYWVATACEIKCDRTVLGRQNLWYWARETGARGFELIAGANGAWKVPAAAMREPGVVTGGLVSTGKTAVPLTPNPSPARGEGNTAAREFVIRRAEKYMRVKAPAISGQGGQQQTFHAAMALVDGFGLSVDEALPLFQSWNAGCVPPWDDAGLMRTLTNAKRKSGQNPSLSLLNVPSPKSASLPYGGGAGAKGYEASTRLEIDDEEVGRIGLSDECSEGLDPLAFAPQPPEGEEVNRECDALEEGGAAAPICSMDSADASSVTIEADEPSTVDALNAWFDDEFIKRISQIELAHNTKRDAMAATLFDALSVRLPKVGIMTRARVKANLTKVLKITGRDFERAIAEANKRREARSDEGFLALAEGYKEHLARGAVRRVMRRWREQWYEWTSAEGCYLPQGDEWVESQAMLWLYDQGIEAAGASVSNFLQALQATTMIHESVKPGSWLENPPTNAKGSIFFSMRNGILNLCDRRRMMEHTPDYFTLNSAPFNYEPEREYERWTAVTLQWQPLDSTASALQILQDWMGYLFVPYNPHKKFLINTGPGNDGKSVYSAICKHIIGERNCSAIGLEAFDPKMTFGLEPMIGKMLNQIGDANMVDKVAEGVLKTLTGNDAQTFGRKFLPAITEVWAGKIMINANHTPYWRDRSNALFNRMLPLHWEPIPDDKINTNLVDELVADELPGIFNWALVGFDRIRQKPFNRDGLVLEWLEQARQETQGELGFFDECVGVDLNSMSTAKVTRPELMAAYKAHCDQRNAKAFCNAETLGKQLREYLRRKFVADGVAADESSAFFARMNGRDPPGLNGDLKRGRHYKGIGLLK
jgi:putative DNA primase/helicase